ncbi:MAG: type IV secretory system conjugative DNA transfer family protein [Oscillospiraceae bacterium]|nr:type IV secretory system conjugative DNA transfer family protein [Oscillospiraceae bacterium]
MWPEIGMDVVNAIFTGAKILGQVGAKGGKMAYDRYKDNQAAAEIAAREEEITRPGLPPELASAHKQGVIFGKWRGQYLVKPEQADGHVLVVGGSGSGKSSCVAIPTLRSWRGGVFAIDIKGELYETTRHFRKNIKVFNPLDNNSCGYDPFYSLRHSDNPAQGAGAIAEAVIPLPRDTKEPFWIESAQIILTGAILHYHGRGAGFLQTVKVIQSTPPKDLIQAILSSDVQEARYCVNSLADMSEKTLSGVMAEISRHVVAFITDRALISALSRPKIITPADLEYGGDIYIQIPEHLLNQWKNLLGMIVNQFMRYFEKHGPARRILFLLDEFPRLGKIEAVTNGLATLRGRGINIMLIVQSLAQLDEIYGRDNRKVIADNCTYQAILSAADADTQELFSRLVGTYDRLKKSYGKNLEIFGLSSNRHEGVAFEKSPIIKPEQFRQLKNDVIVLTPYGFCRVEKAPYYMKTKQT